MRVGNGFTKMRFFLFSWRMPICMYSMYVFYVCILRVRGKNVSPMEAGSIYSWIRVACCRNVSPLRLHLRPLGVAVRVIRLRTTRDSMLPEL